MSEGREGQPGQPGRPGLPPGGRGGKGGRGGQGEAGAIGATGATGARGHKGGIKVSTLILLVILPLVGYLFARDIESVNDRRAACSTENVLREQVIGLLDDLVDVNVGRVNAPGASPSEIQANLGAVKAYSARREATLNSVDPVDEKDPRRVDCEEAHPLPWPLN